MYCIGIVVNTQSHRAETAVHCFLFAARVVYYSLTTLDRHSHDTTHPPAHLRALLSHLYTLTPLQKVDSRLAEQ